MGVVGSYQLWEKDHQAMRESGKLGQTGGYVGGRGVQNRIPGRPGSENPDTRFSG